MKNHPITAPVVSDSVKRKLSSKIKQIQSDLNLAKARRDQVKKNPDLNTLSKTKAIERYDLEIAKLENKLKTSLV